jgi:protocatechuate 4,5-dioxygenase beta chain
MARIIGGIASTHVPAIGKAIAENKQNDPYWKPFFKGFDYVHYWLAREKPDVAVVFYNDHGLNFFLDKLPTFAVGAARANTATRTRAGASRSRARFRAIRPCPGI